MTDSTTPEAGHVNFQYNIYNLLTQRTDARGVVTNYIYDTLNRPVGVSYPTVPSGVAAMPNVCKVNGVSTNNANVCFAYGSDAASYNNGRPISTTDPSGSESYTYDQLGNVTQLDKSIGTTTYTTKYAFNLANELMSITYPSNRVVQQNVDTIGRLSSVIGTLNSVSTTYASAFNYSTAQQVTGFKYGNNIYGSFGFTPDRLQLNCLDYSTTNRSGNSCAHDATTKFGLNYGYDSAGRNNGQIAGITDSVDTGRSATYTYDSLNRLTAAVTTGSASYPQWGLSEIYDRYGNRSEQHVTAGNAPPNLVLIDAVHNRVTGSPYAYDATGNMTNDGQNTMVYDGENRVASAANGGGSGAYIYDGNGLRVKKCLPNCTSPTITTIYIFSGSKVIAEYDNGAAFTVPSREYIYSGSTLLAKIDSSGTKYYHQDHISNRLVTDGSSGNVTEQLGAYPFGEMWYNASNNKLLFTSYERDSESGNDFAMARYSVNRLGRFSSQDKMSGSPLNPQSLNRYAYVANDPIGHVDPLGLCDVVVGGFTQGEGAAGNTQFAHNDHAIQAYPFSGDSVAGSFFDALFSSASSAATLNAVLAAIAQTPDGQKVNVVTFSGGAEQFSDVYNHALNDSQRARIGNITYLSPGAASGGALAVSAGGITTVYIGSTGNSTENTVTSTTAPSWALSSSIDLRLYACDHQATCAFQQARLPRGPACKDPKTFTRQKTRGGGGSGGGRGVSGGGLYCTYGDGPFGLFSLCNNGYMCGPSGCGCVPGPWTGGPCQGGTDGGGGSGCHGDIFEPCDALESVPGGPMQIPSFQASREKTSLWRDWRFATKDGEADERYVSWSKDIPV